MDFLLRWLLEKYGDSDEGASEMQIKKTKPLLVKDGKEIFSINCGCDSKNVFRVNVYKNDEFTIICKLRNMKMPKLYLSGYVDNGVLKLDKLEIPIDRIDIHIEMLTNLSRLVYDELTIL